MINKEQLQHVKRNENNMLVQKILKGEISLRRELQNFYGIHGTEISPFVTQTDEFDNAKVGQKPEEIIDLCAPFSKKSIIDELLSYDRVREDYKYAHKFNIKNLYEFPLFLVGKALSFGFLNPHISNHPKNMGGYDEFRNLVISSLNFTMFINEDYKLIQEVFGNTEEK